jgi:hypothetical protein
MLWFASIVRSEPSLDQKWNGVANRYVRLARKCLDAFDDEFVKLGHEEGGYYFSPYLDCIEPLNHMAGAGKSFILLQQLTGKDHYLVRAASMATYFRAVSWKDEQGNLMWDYSQAPDHRRLGVPELVQKAGITHEFLVFSYRFSLVYSRDDIRSIVDTFMKKVRRNDGNFSRRFGAQTRDGRKVPLSELDFEPSQFKDQRSIARFIGLQEFDSRVRDEVDRLMAILPRSGAWFSGKDTIYAYAQRLRSR